MAIVGLAAHQTSATTGTGAYELDGDVGGAPEPRVSTPLQI